MDPGRKRNETREAQYVAVGETLNVESVLWTVADFSTLDNLIEFRLQREQGDRSFERTLIRYRDEQVTVRNILTSNS